MLTSQGVYRCIHTSTLPAAGLAPPGELQQKLPMELRWIQQLAGSASLVALSGDISRRCAFENDLAEAKRSQK